MLDKVKSHYTNALRLAIFQTGLERVVDALMDLLLALKPNLDIQDSVC